MSTTKSRFAALANSVAAGAFLTLAALLLLIGTPALGAPIPVTPVAVLGNLNPVPNDGTTFTIGRTNQAVAQGFTSGTNVLTLSLKTIRLELAPITGTSAPVVELRSSTGSGTSSTPTSTVLATYTAAPLLSARGVGDFTGPTVVDFAGWYDLAPSTDYWVVVKDAAPSVNRFAWTANEQALVPQALNSSGYAYLNWSRSTTNGASWNQAGLNSSSAAMELVAVPEPPTVILAGLGVAAVVANGYRRRLRRKGADSESADESMEGAVALTA